MTQFSDRGAFVMKKTLLVILCSLSASLAAPVAADPAFVSMFGEGDCFFGWLILEEIPFVGYPNFIFHPADFGIDVDTNSEAGVMSTTCRGTIDFGSPAPEGSDNVFVPFVPLPDDTTLATPEEGCALTGLCPRGRRGATIITGADTGLPCTLGGGLDTFDWRQVVSPSGETVITCHFRE
jgi:hypothetical protein